VRRLLAIALLAAGCATGSDGEGPVVAIVGATVIDPGTARVIPDAVLLVREGRLAAVGDRVRVRIPRDAEKVELPGYWIVPGFIDLHATMRDTAFALSLRHGVTTVRHLVAAVESVTVTTAIPRRVPALVIDGLPATYPGAAAVRDSAAIDALLALALLRGMRWVHLTPTVEEATQGLVIRRAALRGMMVDLSPAGGDVLAAVREGAGSVSGLGAIAAAAGQGRTIVAGYRANPAAGIAAAALAWFDVDPLAADQVAADLAATGTTLVPLLVRNEVLSRLDDADEMRRAELAMLPGPERASWEGWAAALGWSAGTFADLRMLRPAQDAFLRHFLAAGGRIAAGSGAGAPYHVAGADLHREMALLVAAGLTPMQALAAATSRAADALRTDTLGRFREGAAADLVVLSGDPLHDIRNTRRIHRVMVGGVWQ
jgi:hypothetical protein